jgi:carboxyl-terminal processing protease
MTATVTKRALAALGVLLVLCLGLWWGGHPSHLPGFARSLFVANAHDVVIDEALSDIQADYYRPVGRTGLINGAVAGAVASLGDPYANYETPPEFNSFNNPSPVKFSGVGITVVPSRAEITIESVLPGSPAAHAGLHIGDEIIFVDGRTVAGLGSQRAVNDIHGRVGSTVTLGIRRGARSLRVTIRRAVIDTPLVTGTLEHYRGMSFGVIELPTFDVPGIHAQVAQTLQSLLDQHVKGIVLDLRYNPGGLVTEAQLVVSMFLSKGVIVTTRGRTQATQVLRATGHPIAPTIPLAVLVNRDTASAAEIATGALQDHHRAVIVGTRTYGKGVFQEIQPLSNGGAIVVTVGQYYLPDGQNLGAGGLRRGPGIKPNVLVSAAPSATSDPQLAAALRVLASRAH